MRGQFSDESELVRRLAASDRTAFEHLYRLHKSALVRVCTGVVGSRATAEEVAQDTWIAVLQNIAGFEGRSTLAGWIFSILINKARTRAKRDGRTVSFDNGGDDYSLADAFDGRGRWKDLPELWDDLTPERIVAGRSLAEHVHVAIDALPPLQRSVLVMRTMQGIDSGEISSILAISEANVRISLHRARLAIRAVLDQLS